MQEDDLSTLAGDLSDGIDEAGDPPTDEASGTLAALVTAGTDAPATFTLSAVTSGLPSLTSKGDAVTYSVTDGATEDTLTATAGGRTVFTLVVAANRAYTFDLKDQLDHADGGDAATLAIDLSSVIVATDADGDSVTPPANAFVINVENDVPVASGATESATVQEDDLSTSAGDLSDGIDEAGDPPTDEASGTLTALVTPGADEPATFSLSAVTSGLPSLTSKGDAVTYSVTDGATDDTLTATAGGRTVFTLAVAANGGLHLRPQGPARPCGRRRRRDPGDRFVVGDRGDGLRRRQRHAAGRCLRHQRRERRADYRAHRGRAGGLRGGRLRDQPAQRDGRSG